MSEFELNSLLKALVFKQKDKHWNCHPKSTIKRRREHRNWH